MKKIVFIAVLFVILLISCGKKGDPYPKKPTLNEANSLVVRN